MHSRTARDYILRDTWVTSPLVTVLLLVATLAYLLVESAFNARLVNVLGATAIDETHTAAIAGLEFWGRILSSVAVGLALLSLYIAQASKHQAPAPLNFLALIRRGARHREPWGAGNWSFALAVVLMAMLGTFHGERLWVERGAEDASADDRWWMFYAVRAVDAALIYAGQFETYVREHPEDFRKPEQPHQPPQPAPPGPEPAQGKEQSPSLIPEKSRFPGFAVTYLNEPRTFTLNRFEGADWRVSIAITPHGVQNFARSQRTSESQEEPMTPREIQASIEKTLSEDATKIAGPLVKAAALDPVQRCLDAIYDQSAFAADVASFDPTLCVTRSATADQLSVSRPQLWAAVPEHCLAMENGARRRFADFVMFRCALAENDTRFSAAADSAAQIYLIAYARERAELISAYKADPRTLPAADADQLVFFVDAALGRNADIAAAVPRGALNLGSREFLPACGRLDELLLTRLRVARARANDMLEARVWGWLSSLDDAYCTYIDTLVPAAPGGTHTALWAPRIESLRRAAQLGLDATFEELSIQRRIQLPPGWNAPPATEHREWVRNELLAPIKTAIGEVIGDQLGASADLRALIPDPAFIQSREAFQANTIVSQLFGRQIQTLTDSAFGCLGLESLRGQALVDRNLGQLMSVEGTAAFNERVGRLIFENVFRTRLTGTIDDFELNGRCGSAGVTAYHRGHIPGFALLVSMIGLFYHSRKAVLYVLRLLSMPTLVRHSIAAGAVLLLLVAPLLTRVEALRVSEVDILLQRYSATHGAFFEFGVRWLIKAQALYHPVTDKLYKIVFEPLGIDFTREIEPHDLDIELARIDQACGLVPQIRQTPQYQALRTVITHRDLCRASLPSAPRVTAR
jgi:hypothetical protein